MRGLFIAFLYGICAGSHEAFLAGVRKMQCGGLKMIISDHYVLRDKCADRLFVDVQYFWRIAVPGSQQTIADQQRIGKKSEAPVAHAECSRTGKT